MIYAFIPVPVPPAPLRFARRDACPDVFYRGFLSGRVPMSFIGARPDVFYRGSCLIS